MEVPLFIQFLCFSYSYFDTDIYRENFPLSYIGFYHNFGANYLIDYHYSFSITPN